MKKGRFLGILLTMSFAFGSVLSGCSSSEQANSGNGDKQAKAEQKKGGELVIVRLSDATKLDPHFITDIPSANVVYQKVYQTLVMPDKDMHIQPLLATEWKQPDDLTWEFKLRQGVQFHDGAPFNAEAVKKNFDRLMDPKVGSPQASKFGMVEEIKVIDEYTVQFILSEPYAPLLSILAANEGSIISPKAIAENSGQIAQHPVGTGPFKFGEWKSGQEITIVKNDGYWGDKPKIDKVVFKVIPEDTTRIAMVETGEAHINDQVPVTEIERIQASDAMSLYRTEGLAVEYVGFNTQKKPFDDVRVRQAFSHAIETEAIIAGVYNNIGTKATTAMSQKIFGFSPDAKGYEYDINKAKDLLKEAGYAEGMEVTLVTSDRKERINMAEVLQSQLKGIGVNLKIQVLEYGAYLETVNKGEHQLFIGGWGNATGDGDYNQYNLFHSSSVGAPGNHFYYQNPEVDKLIEAARKERDAEKRKALYAKSLQMEMDDAVYVPIRNYEHLAVLSKKVNGFWLSPVNYAMLNDVTIQE